MTNIVETITAGASSVSTNVSAVAIAFIAVWLIFAFIPPIKRAAKLFLGR